MTSAASYRLVEAPKSPTGIWGAADWNPAGNFAEIEPELKPRAVAGNVPAWAIAEQRSWSGEYRIRTQTESTSGQKPPTQTARFTEKLTDSGARKIADSCAYVAAKFGGFTTFITGTFAPENREKIATGETTVQREVTRIMDAISKRYQRGFTYRDEKGQRVKVYGARKGRPFCYLWVVEMPTNEAGEINPHVHILMNWQVRRKHFAAWAKGLEAVWSNGYFHLEKIREPESAGAYMAKAANYLTKGKAGEQGKVRGNRYAINKAARAPGWSLLQMWPLHSMGALIAQAHDAISQRFGHLYQARRALNEKRETMRTLAKNASDDKQREMWETVRNETTEKLKTVRAKIRELPIRAGKYLVTIKGEDFYLRFLRWARGIDQGEKCPIGEAPVIPFDIHGNQKHNPTAARRFFVNLRAAREAMIRRKNALTENALFDWAVEKMQSAQEAAAEAFYFWENFGRWQTGDEVWQAM